MGLAETLAEIYKNDESLKHTTMEAYLTGFKSAMLVLEQLSKFPEHVAGTVLYQLEEEFTALADIPDICLEIHYIPITVMSTSVQ